MANNNDPVTVILDNRIHRILDIGVKISLNPAYNIVLNSSIDPVSHKPVDSIQFTNGAVNATVPCSGTYIPPASGQHIGDVSDSTHQSKVSLFPSKQRIILLGANLSSDANYVLRFTNAAPGQTDQVTLTANGVDTVAPADGDGDKVPPKTGLA